MSETDNIELNKYISLDFCLNTLYDKVYNPEPKNCYIVPPIVRNDISLEMIKRTNKEYTIEVTNQGKFKYLGYFNNKWIFTRMSDTSYSCLVSIGEYDTSKNSNLNDMGRSELINMAMHYILSELVISDKLKYILLPVMNYDTDYNDLGRKNNGKYLLEKINLNNKNAKFYVNVNEQYFDMYTLREFLEINGNDMELLDWKVLFFQILYTLYKISERLRKFRHNNLNLDAIRVYKIFEKRSDRYRVGDKIFEIPNIGMEIRITDFDKSYTADYIRNKDTTLVSENPYFDVHYVFQYIIWMLDKLKININELNRVLLEIVPEKFRYENENDFVGLDENLFDSMATMITTPGLILRKNNFFSEFIVESLDKMDLSASPLQDNSEDINKLNRMQKNINYDNKSPTETSTDAPRMLGRKSNSNNSGLKKKDYIIVII